MLKQAVETVATADHLLSVVQRDLVMITGATGAQLSLDAERLAGQVIAQLDEARAGLREFRRQLEAPKADEDQMWLPVG